MQFAALRKSGTTYNTMKYLSLFSGIGGFELGIQQTYEQQECWEHEERNCITCQTAPRLDNWRTAGTSTLEERRNKSVSYDSNGNGRRTNPVCIGYSEINKYAAKVYQSHFPNHHNYGDITAINASELPDFDLLVGGFPCQSFSIAGKRGGFSDTRGTLFFDIARILKSKHPRGFLLENVKGLLSHDNGRTFKTIISTLTELGYDLQWQVLNSKNFGVPQNRERIFIIGHLRGTTRPEVFPFTRESTEDIGTSSNGEPAEEKYIATRHLGRNGKLKSSISGTVQASEIPHIIEPRPKHGKPIYPMAECPTIQTHWGTGGNNVALVNGIRRLTPVECARLQGFPDDWCSALSDSQAYKCYGNAVTVNVVQAIMSKLLNDVAPAS